MKKHFAERLFLALFGLSLLSLPSCVKEECQLLLSGTWAEVDDNMMTQHVVSFSSGMYTTMKAGSKYLTAEGTIWNCLEKDFANKNSSRYEVVDGVVIIKSEGKRGKQISVNGDEMSFDGGRYIRIESFKEDYYRTIAIPNNQVECNFTGGDQIVNYTLKNFENAAPVATCDAAWINSINCTSNAVTFKVDASTESREGTIILSYYGAEDQVIHVNQKAARVITANPAIVYASYTAQNKSITASVTNGASGINFTASSNESWISSVTAAGAVVTFTLAENNTGSARDGSVIVSYTGADDLIVPVHQEYNASAIYISTTSFSLSADAGTYTTGYTIDYPREGKSLTCSSKPYWVTSVTFNETSVIFTVSANTGTAKREDSIILSYNDANATITLSQTGADELNVSRSTWQAPYDGGSISFTVKHNSAWDISCSEDWLTVSKSKVSGNTTTVSMTAALNNSGAERTAKCIVTSAKETKEITVTQPTTTLTTNMSHWGSDYTADSHSLYIYASGDWEISSDQPWLTFSQTSGTGETSITMYSSANDFKGAVQRTAVATLKDLTYNLTYAVNVTQIAFTPSLKLSEENVNVPYAGKSGSISITSNVSWTATSSMSWLTIDPKSATTNHSNIETSLNYTVDVNDGTSTRTGTVTIKNEQYDIEKTITFSQVADEAIRLSVLTSDMSIGPDAGTKSVFVDANIDWKAKSNESWLTVDPTASTGEKALTFAFEQNTTGSAREGTFTVYNENYGIYRDIHVLQPEYSFNVSTSSWSLDRNASSRVITITSNSTSNWTVTSSHSWLTSNITSGSGNVNITISVTDNTSVLYERTGTITVRNASFGVEKTVTVTQGKTPAYISFSSSSWNPDCGKQTSASITVTSNVSWTASSSASWLTVSKSSGAAGTNYLTLTVTGNNSTSSRTATVSFTNAETATTETITVSQYGYTLCGVYLNYTPIDLGITIDRTATYTFVLKGWGAGSSSVLFGLSATSGSYTWRFYKSGNYYYFRWGSTYIRYYYTTSITGSYRKFVLSNYAMAYYASESTASYTWSTSGSTQSSVPSSTETLKIGNANSYLTFKSLKVQNSSGTTTHNFIGVQTNGITGVYDTVTGVFIVGGTYQSL